MNRKIILWFFLGASCFIISQPLLRIPLLQLIQQSTDFMLAYTLYPLLIGILIALSAGVFEEGFRFLYKQFIIKPGECTISQPLVFGLGHGIAEAVIVLAPAITVVPLSQLGVAFLERFLAIILHVSLTIVVWNGFQKKQRACYLLLAILIHGLVDSSIPVFASFPNPIVLIESALAGIDVLLIGYVIYSRKYYLERKSCSNEENNI